MAQFSGSAYRALGQPDLRRNGVNMVLGLEMHGARGIALDDRNGKLHLYVSDTGNHRVQAWEDVRAYQTGDAPAIVLGQPSPKHSLPLGIGTKGFNSPYGLAVDPLTGNLYAADTGGNRVLRFPYPFANRTRVEPDAVYGQTDFSGRAAGVAGGLNAPRGLAFDSQANLWVADTGNHRVLRFNVSSLDQTNPIPDLVLGQKDMTGNARNLGSDTPSAAGFDSPVGLGFDSTDTLFVADYNNLRVLRFASPVLQSASAAAVFGQAGFTRRLTAPVSSSTLAGPVGVAVSKSGNLYVAVAGDSRVLVFDANAASSAAAKDVLGQADFSSAQANAASFPLASSRTLAAPWDVKLDSDGKLYVADADNNRVLAFPNGAKTANSVWGQNDFSSNAINQLKPGSVNNPGRIAIDYSRSPFALYVSDTANHRVLVWKDAARFRTGDPASLAIGQPNLTTAIANVDTRGSSTPAATSLSSPRGLAVDGAGNLYVADTGNHRVLRFPRPVDQSGRITPDAVLGQSDFKSALSAGVSAVSLRSPYDVAIGPDGDIFVADTENNRVLEFAANAATGAAAIRVYGQPAFTSASSPSPVSAQTLSSPMGLCIDKGSTLYVADTGNNRVVLFANTKDAPTAGAAAALVAGQGDFSGASAGTGAARLRAPSSVALDSQGNLLVADTGNNRVLVFPSLLFLQLAGASATATIGQQDMGGSAANWNSTGGLATPEGLAAPAGVFVDRRDTVYIADSGNNRVLHFLKPATILHAASLQSGLALARGGIARMLGSGLADTQDAAPGSSLPMSLAGRELVINDETPAPLSLVSPDRVQLQVPSNAPLGSVRLAVRTSDSSELVASANASLASISPGLFAANDETLPVLNQDDTANGTSNPALKGGTIKVFGTGQGPTNPQVADGTAAPSDPGASTVAVPTSDGTACVNNQPSICVAIGSTFGNVVYSGLAPGMVGIWQLTVKIPLTASSGNAVPVRAVIDGTPTNIITVAIK